MLKQFFLARIEEAQSLDELNYIVEQAANSDLSYSHYEEIYQAARLKALEWATAGRVDV